MATENLGIQKLEYVDFVVHNLERSRDFYVNQMGMDLLGTSSDALEQESGEQSLWFQAGRAKLRVTSPSDEGSLSDRFLRSHPDGVRTIGMRVDDADFAFKTLDERGANIIDEIQGDDHWRSFRIASPLGDVEFEFIERQEEAWAPTGFNEAREVAPKGNPHQFTHMDHITSNTRDMRSLTNWYRDVLGFEHFWDIRFHTTDSNPESTGSGLNSIVMREPNSNIKFATNEPLRPHLYNSQIQKFVEDNRGPGVQHVALSTKAIMDVIPDMNQRGLKFLETPEVYYKMLPERMAEREVDNLKESIEDLMERKILVDGRDNRYLLQIFMQEAALLYNEAQAGPFFYEVIQRHGEQGFGEGNFRALFESIERMQNQ